MFAIFYPLRERKMSRHGGSGGKEAASDHPTKPHVMTQFFYSITLTFGLFLGGCAVTSHPSTPTRLGRPFSAQEALQLAARPGVVQLTRIEAATWEVERAGLINLDHPKAVAAALENQPEPIVIQFFELTHPTQGLYMIDTGVATSFRSADTAPVNGFVLSAMNFDALVVKQDTAQWLKRQSAPLKGVFLTHLHLDHLMGLVDIPKDVPLYTGPGEADCSQFMNLFVQGTTDHFLDGFGDLQELSFARKDQQPGNQADLAVVDVFNDQQVFALHVPGHTPGSLAFLVRTPDGPRLILGDASHTTWGWENHVEPGTFNADLELAAVSLHKLEALAAHLPNVVVYPGHQHF